MFSRKSDKKVAFLTTIFPMKKAYLHDFFNSLQQQTYKNFDVIVLNDGFVNFEEFITTFDGLNIIELPYSDTIAKNREFGINYVIQNNYDFLVFGDSDDCFDINRVQISVDILKDFDIIVNDLTLFNDENGVYYKKYISNRVENNTEIELDFIKDKNIFGLSNTAVKVSALDPINFDKDLIAVDWYLFSILLLKRKSAIFINDTVTYYRQYVNNTIGMDDVSDKSILQGILVKLKQYKLLKEIDMQFDPLFKTMNQLQGKIEDKQYIDKLKKQNIKNPLWWEEVQLLKEEG